MGREMESTRLGNLVRPPLGDLSSKEYLGYATLGAGYYGFGLLAKKA
jgi:hypothetical protein